jgi:hypothetical protein
VRLATFKHVEFSYMVPHFPLYDSANMFEVLVTISNSGKGGNSKCCIVDIKCFTQNSPIQILYRDQFEILQECKLIIWSMKMNMMRINRRMMNIC